MNFIRRISCRGILTAVCSLVCGLVLLSGTATAAMQTPNGFQQSQSPHQVGNCKQTQSVTYKDMEGG